MGGVIWVPYVWKIIIWAQKLQKVIFALVKMASKGVIEKNEKVFKKKPFPFIFLKK